MVAWGDSLTASSGSTGSTTTFPARLGVLARRVVQNQGVGGETSTSIATRMLAGTAYRASGTIIWAGRNNFSSSATVQADIAAMVASLTTTNYLVLSIMNGTTELSGSASYNQIIALNAALAATYGSRYVDIRSYLVSLYDPGTPQDVIDHGNDVPPSTLRSDALHLNDAGYQAVANYVYRSIALLGVT